MTDHQTCLIDIAAEAQETYKQIRQLNKKLASARNAQEKELLRAEIAKAQADWYRKVAPELNRRHAIMQDNHREAIRKILKTRNRKEQSQ